MKLLQNYLSGYHTTLPVQIERGIDTLQSIVRIAHTGTDTLSLSTSREL